MNHVSVSPTMELGPHKDRENLWPGWEWTHDLRVRSPPLYQLSYKVRREQAVGTEDGKVTAINMYRYKERLRLYKRWPCGTYILNRINWRECNVTWSARFLCHMNHVSVSPTDGTGPTQGQRKTLTRVRIEPTTFGLDLRRSTDWATRSDGSRPWELKMLKSRQLTCTGTRKGYVYTNVILL